MKYTITITNQETQKEMTIAVDDLDDLRKKTIAGKWQITEFIQRAKELL